MYRYIPVIAIVVGTAAPSAAGAPMFTKLAKVRAEAKQVVVGTVSSTKRGLFINVEYTLRGTAGKGRMKVRRSPDGHVWVPVGKKPRVVAFIDQQHRFRWIGKLLAGPSLERGVLRLEGFFDFNAHIVGPGTMTLTQLQHYLVHGTLNQRYRASIVVPDGKGGLARSKHSVTLDFDPFKRKVALVKGGRWPCLNNPSLSVSWRFSLHFYCRFRDRRLTLTGRITGKAKSGVILADVSPTNPILYSAELDRFLKTAKPNHVSQVLRVSVANGMRLRWIVGKGLMGARGAKLHKSTGTSVSSTRKGNVTVRTESFRFRGIMITVKGGKHRTSNHFS